MVYVSSNKAISVSFNQKQIIYFGLMSDCIGLFRFHMVDFSSFPEDVLINIILRLPIKYVFCSRSVCKNWNSVLQSPIFSFLYYDHQLYKQERLANDGVSSFIVLEYVESKSFAKWFPTANIKHDMNCPYGNYDSPKGYLSYYRDYFDRNNISFDPAAYVLLSFVTLKKMNDDLITTIDRVEKLDIHFTSIEERVATRYIRFSNVYDGIICLEDEIGVILYNPYSRESQKLPFYPCTHRKYYHVVLGLWLEPGTIKHYKIFSLLVLINDIDMDPFTYVIEKYNSTFTFVIEEYDSIESSWTEIKTMPNRTYPFKRYNCLLFNEILHLYDDPYSDSLITLDVRSETFGILPLPSGIQEWNIKTFPEDHIIACGKSHFIGSCFAPHIFVLRRSLAMFAENSVSCTDIWIMTEYGIKESWTKQYTICEEYITPIDFYSAPLNHYSNPCFDDGTPYSFNLWWKLLLNWKCMDEDKMILEARNMISFDSEQKYYAYWNVIDPRRKLVSFNLFSNKLTEIDMFVTGKLLSSISCIETIISFK